MLLSFSVNVITWVHYLDCNSSCSSLASTTCLDILFLLFLHPLLCIILLKRFENRIWINYSALRICIWVFCAHRWFTFVSLTSIITFNPLKCTFFLLLLLFWLLDFPIWILLKRCFGKINRSDLIRCPCYVLFWIFMFIYDVSCGNVYRL